MSVHYLGRSAAVKRSTMAAAAQLCRSFHALAGVHRHRLDVAGAA